MEQVKNTIAEVFEEIASGLVSGNFGKRVRVGLTLNGSEHGESEMLKGAEQAQASDPSIEVVVIGPKMDTNLTQIEADNPDVAHQFMD